MRLIARLKTASPDSEIRRINQALFPAPAKQQPLSPAPPQ
jgi:hypothetical protein